MVSRSGWTLLALAGASLAWLTPSSDRALRDLHGPDLGAGLVGLATVLQLTLAAWVLLAATLHLCRVPAPVVRAVVPPLLRRAMFAGAAGVLVMTPARADRSEAPRETHEIAGLRLPDRPVGAIVVRGDRHVVVAPGDTLWAIAARSLRPDAGADEVAAACARWHDANRRVIGDDPDLIFPSQRLVPPSGKDPT